MHACLLQRSAACAFLLLLIWRAARLDVMGAPGGGDCQAGRAVQVAGSLALKKARAGAQLQGVLVQQGGRHTVVAAQDLPAFTILHPGRILQRQILSLRKPFSEVRLQA